MRHVAAKKSFEETLRRYRAIVESKIKQLEADLKKVEEAAAGLPLVGCQCLAARWELHR